MSKVNFSYREIRTPKLNDKEQKKLELLIVDTARQINEGLLRDGKMGFIK